MFNRPLIRISNAHWVQSNHIVGNKGVNTLTGPAYPNSLLNCKINVLLLILVTYMQNIESAKIVCLDAPCLKYFFLWPINLNQT